MYSLYRERDGVGDSGGMSDAAHLDERGDLIVEHDSEPQVGKSIRVGSTYARTMESQDWWQTTPVQEILEREEGEGTLKIKFRTRNSVYTWRAGF